MSVSALRCFSSRRGLATWSIILFSIIACATAVGPAARRRFAWLPVRVNVTAIQPVIQRLPAVTPEPLTVVIASTALPRRLPPVDPLVLAQEGLGPNASWRLPAVDPVEVIELAVATDLRRLPPLSADEIDHLASAPPPAPELLPPSVVSAPPPDFAVAPPAPAPMELVETPERDVTLPAPPPAKVVAGPTDPPSGSDALAWWEPTVTGRLRPDEGLPLSLNSAVLATLRHSPRVRAISDRAIVRELAIDEASAKFDPRTFMDTRFSSASDPVGNALTTGGSDRFLDTNLYTTGGIRKLTSSGAQLEASQRLGWQDTNSIYFIPGNQGTAKLSLTVTQPLLKGAGECYQKSTLVLAEIDAAIAHDQLCRDLQNSLVEVHKLYWELYVERATLLQRSRLLRESAQILAELEARQEVDVLGSQLVRAKAAHARREVAITRGLAAVKNAESRLRAIISDPVFLEASSLEIITSEVPSEQLRAVDLTYALGAALQHRPELQIAIQETRIASKRMEIAQHELRPTLDLIVGSYLSGLNGETDLGRSFGDQFSTGRPTYWAGVQFDAPWQNRAAQARMKQRRVELRQITHQLQAVTNNVRAEVEIAVREIDALTKERQNREHAVRALRTEVAYLTERWRLLPAEGADAGVVLEDILTAQERVADAEQEFVRAQAAQQLAHIELLRVTGELLAYEKVVEEKTMEDGLPAYRMVKAQLDPPPPPQAPEEVPAKETPLDNKP